MARRLPPDVSRCAGLPCRHRVPRPAEPAVHQRPGELAIARARPRARATGPARQRPVARSASRTAPTARPRSPLTPCSLHRARYAFIGMTKMGQSDLPDARQMTTATSSRAAAEVEPWRRRRRRCLPGPCPGWPAEQVMIDVCTPTAAAAPAPDRRRRRCRSVDHRGRAAHRRRDDREPPERGPVQDIVAGGPWTTACGDRRLHRHGSDGTAAGPARRGRACPAGDGPGRGRDRARLQAASATHTTSVEGDDCGRRCSARTASQSQNATCAPGSGQPGTNRRTLRQ